jgi:hypothetical protein
VGTLGAGGEIPPYRPSVLLPSAAGDVAGDTVPQLKRVNCGSCIDLVVSQGQTHAVGRGCGTVAQ